MPFTLMVITVAEDTGVSVYNFAFELEELERRGRKYWILNNTSGAVEKSTFAQLRLEL